jgi:hypothetical protein
VRGKGGRRRGRARASEGPRAALQAKKERKMGKYYFVLIVRGRKQDQVEEEKLGLIS